MMKRIAVVGGGIIGVTTAVVLQDRQSAAIQVPPFEIDLISERWSPETTGDVSAGLIYPYLAGEQTPHELMMQLLQDSIRYFQQMWKTDDDAGKHGLSLITMFELFRDDFVRMPVAHESLPLVRRLTREELTAAGFPPEYRSGLLVNTFIAEPKLLLPYLMKRFTEKGGRLVTKKIDSLGSLLATGGYDRVINCAGIGVLDLQDHNDGGQLRPVRGQVIRVWAPWIRHAIMADQWYILPQNDCIVLGGTKDRDRFELQPDPVVRQQIWHGCKRLCPALKSAKPIADGIGLRPYRPVIRIEPDAVDKRIIHNYGHGGSGVTLSWGSAFQVDRILHSGCSNF